MWNSHLKSFGLGDYLGYDLNIGRPGFIPDGNYYNFGILKKIGDLLLQFQIQ